MERDAALYDLFMEAAGAIYAAMSEVQARTAPPVPPPVLQLRAGLAESPGWFLVQAAEFVPEPLTVERLRVRDIYASERIVAALLEIMAGERWLERDMDGSYSLTDVGRAALQARRAARAALLAKIGPLPLTTQQLERLQALIQRLINASVASPTPPGSWCLAHSRRRAPAPDAPLLVQLMQLFDDINAFRDDAHMAAWRPFDIEGYAWEAFALICAGDAGSAEQVAEQLAHRGYSPGEYRAALEQLAARGWLASAGGAYQLTETGKAARANAERLTNIYFYRPWSALGPAEAQELHELLARLRDEVATP